MITQTTKCVSGGIPALDHEVLHKKHASGGRSWTKAPLGELRELGRLMPIVRMMMMMLKTKDSAHDHVLSLQTLRCMAFSGAFTQK